MGRCFSAARAGSPPDADRFAIDVGASYHGVSPFEPDFVRPTKELRPRFVDEPIVMYAPSHRVRATSGKSLGEVFDPYFNRTGQHFCSHQHTPPRPDPSGYDAAILSDGLIYLAHPAFTIYQSKGAVAAKEYVAAAVRHLLDGKPSVSTSLPSFGRVAVNTQKDKNRDVVHLLCAAPLYRGTFKRGPIEVVEDLIALPNVTVSLRLDHAVIGASLEPQGIDLPIARTDGAVNISVPHVTGHQMVVLRRA